MTVKRRESRYTQRTAGLRLDAREACTKIQKNELIAVLLLRVRAEDELSACTP